MRLDKLFTKHSVNMKIVIAGALEVGVHLAKLLAKENHDVVLMDSDVSRVSQMSLMNLMTLVGSPTSIHSLTEAGVPECDLFVAVTPNESTNIHACILAANLGARRTMARVDNYETQKADSAMFYKRIGISDLVYPEMLGGQFIAEAIARPWARQSVELCEGSLLLLAVKVREGAPIVGQKLMDIGKKHHESFHVAAIRRDVDFIIPGGNDVVQAEDMVYFVTLPQKADVVRYICGKKDRDLRRIIILGVTRMGIQLCYYLKKDYDIVFIEDNQKEVDHAMDKVPKAKALRGLKKYIETLQELNIGEHDAFVAVGPDSDSNILACLSAKKLGVGKSIVEVSDVEQVTMAQTLNIGSTVHKKSLTADSIYQILLDSDKTNAKCFSLIDAEVIDLTAQTGSKITEKPVMELKLPRGITFGGMVRDGHGQTVTGRTHVQPGDQVVVICRNESIAEIQKFFN